MLWQKFLFNFSNRLQVYGKGDISEDSMMYDFFAACLQSGGSANTMQQKIRLTISPFTKAKPAP